MRRLVSVALVAAALAVTAPAAHAATAPSSPEAPEASGAPAATERRSARAAALRAVRKVIHGDLVVLRPDGTTQAVTIDRGQVTAVTDDSITIERPDGVGVTAALTDETRFRGFSREKLEPGVPALVVHADGSAIRVVTHPRRARCAEHPAACRRVADRRAGARNGS